MQTRKLHNQFHVGKNGICVANFSKNCIFPNIQLKGVVKRLCLFKILSDLTNKPLISNDNRKIKHYIKKIINLKALKKKNLL